MAVQTDNPSNSGSLMYKNSKCEARLGSMFRPCVKKEKKDKKMKETKHTHPTPKHSNNHKNMYFININ